MSRPDEKVIRYCPNLPEIYSKVIEKMELNGPFWKIGLKRYIKIFE